MIWPDQIQKHRETSACRVHREADLGGNQGCSIHTMTLISVHYAHYPTSVAKHAGLVRVGVFFVVGVGMVNTAMCFLLAAAHRHNSAHDLSVWGMIILKDKDFKEILGGQNITAVITRDGRDGLEWFWCRWALKENSHAVTSLFVDCARKCDNCTFSCRFYFMNQVWFSHLTPPVFRQFLS